MLAHLVAEQIYLYPSARKKNAVNYFKFYQCLSSFLPLSVIELIKISSSTPELVSDISIQCTRSSDLSCVCEAEFILNFSAQCLSLSS